MLTIKLKKDARVGPRDFRLTTRSLPPQIFWTCRPSHLRQVVDLLQCCVRCPHGLVDWDVKLLPGGMWYPRTSHCGAQLTVHTCLADWRSFLRGACASQSHHAAPARRYSQQFQQAPFQNLWTRVELPKVSQQTHTRHPALPAQECADRQGVQSRIPYPPQAVGSGLLPGLDHDLHLHVKNGVAAVCGAVLPGHGQPLAEDCQLRV